MVNKKVDLFDAKNMAVIAIIMIVGLGGLGGHYGFENGMIPIGNVKLPFIATAAVIGIVLNCYYQLTKSQKPIRNKILVYSSTGCVWYQTHPVGFSVNCQI